MISTEQANAAAELLLEVKTKQLLLRKEQKDKLRKSYRTKPFLGLLWGMAVGTLIGCLVCRLMTGRISPGLTIGQGFGSGLGVLIGLYVDGKTSQLSELLFWIIAGVMIVIGALPFGLIHLGR